MSYQDLYSLEGLQFVPVNEQKRPLIKDWQTSLEKHDLTKCYGVGLVCGTPSGNVQCLDIDTKYDLTGKLYENYKKTIHRLSPNLLEKLVVQKTKSGGYHFIFRCTEISGNEKLANRRTTDEERKKTYEDTYKAEITKGTEDSKAKALAKKSSDNDKVRVLLETRGAGGQFVIEPTPGYKFVFGDLQSISEITPDEREVLFSVAMSFNEVVEEIQIPKKTVVEKTNGLSPFEDYNQRGDVVGLLQQNGWKVVSNKGNKTHLLRPGQTTAATSGNFDHEKNWFSVFTTSTQFEPQRAYLPYAVYCVLEAGNDYSLASNKLLALGYGQKKEAKEATLKSSTRSIESRVDLETPDISLFANPSDYNEYLKSVIDGTLVMGKTTGSSELDQHFLHKEGDLVMVNGIDNVGKTEVVWYLALLSAMYHGFVWTIFSSENTIGSFMRRTIQLFWGKPLRGDYAMTEDEYVFAKDFIEKHFKIIKAQERLYNYKDLINLEKIAINQFGASSGLIDPYNSLKIDLSGFSKLSTHEYHYEAISEIKAFGQQYKFSQWINHHAVTAAIRQKDADKKYSVAPRKEDTEGGGKVPNKADQFLTVHRLTNHPTEWMNTEIHVRKVKDTETGGRPTFIDEPVKFQRYKGGYAYCELLKDGSLGLDPVEEWHYKRLGKVSSKSIFSQQNLWSPYKDNDGSEISF